MPKTPRSGKTTSNSSRRKSSVERISSRQHFWRLTPFKNHHSRQVECGNRNLSRRGFVQRSLAILAAAGLPAWYARQLLAAQDEGVVKKPSANDRLVMGIIGIGSPQSRSLQVVNESSTSVKSGDLTFTLGCDVDASHRKRATEVMRQRGFKEFEAKTGDFRELVADQSLDCLLVTTPDHWHAQVAIEALKAGKATCTSARSC